MRQLALLLAVTSLLAPAVVRADESEAHYTLCLSHKKAGKMEDAERECRIALQKRSDNVSAIYTLGTLLRAKNQLDEALNACRQQLREQVDNLSRVGEDEARCRAEEEAQRDKLVGNILIGDRAA